MINDIYYLGMLYVAGIVGGYVLAWLIYKYEPKKKEGMSTALNEMKK